MQRRENHSFSVSTGPADVMATLLFTGPPLREWSDPRKRSREEPPVRLEDSEFTDTGDKLPPAHDVYRARRKMRTKASPLHG